LAALDGQESITREEYTHRTEHSMNPRKSTRFQSNFGWQENEPASFCSWEQLACPGSGNPQVPNDSGRQFRGAVDRSRGFHASQLIEYTLEPNPDAEDDNGGRAQAPPSEKLSFAFSTADVVVLGWRLGRLHNIHNRLVVRLAHRDVSAKISIGWLQIPRAVWINDIADLNGTVVFVNRINLHLHVTVDLSIPRTNEELILDQRSPRYIRRDQFHLEPWLVSGFGSQIHKLVIRCQQPTTNAFNYKRPLIPVSRVDTIWSQN
jgi:hypothetical protein